MSTLYVAEIGSMHEGNPALACEMARLCKEAGADILKMQFGRDPKDPVRYVGPEFAATVAHFCERLDLELMASLWSAEGLAVARHVNMRRYKIAHQMVDADLIGAALADGKETFISRTVYDPLFQRTNVRAIFTTNQYPTYPWDLTVPGEFTDWWGYSDHTHGLGACLLAVARGARYIEKHVTLNKASQTIRDNAFSATPSEFAELVRLGRALEGVRDAAV